MTALNRAAFVGLLAAATAGTAHAQATTITAWNFENLSIATNNSPAPSTGVGVASSLGMTNAYNSTTAVTTDDVLQGVASGSKTDTGANGLSNASQIWRVRGQSPGNGWSSQAAIGTQGVEFDASTAGYQGITVSFDWYATTQGEANLQLQYTTNGTTWINAPINIGSNASEGLTALTNSTSSSTVTGAYISDNKVANGSLAGQDWFQGLTATITDPAAANDASFGIRLVNASTGTDDLSTQGTALNNTSGNWRFDNVVISGTAITAAVPEPASNALLLAGLIGLGVVVRARRKV